MSRSTIVKLLIFLLALAIALGLIQNAHDPYLGNKKYSFSNNPELQGELRTFLEKAQQLDPQNQQTSTATFLAVGDIMLSRNVAAAIEKANDVNLPFSKMAAILKSTDFNFGNLESPFTDKGNTKLMNPKSTGTPCEPGCPCDFKGGIVGGHSMIFSAPCLYINGLSRNNFQILNLANNHAFDQGLEGLEYTAWALHDSDSGINHIQHVGTGKNLDEAWQPAVVETNGIKTCFIGASYASVNDSGKTKNNYVARIEDLDNLKSSILNLKSTCDFVVASMHAGTEYTRKPSQAQIDFAHTAIDYGADMVIGAHPHWVQTIERYCPNSASLSNSPSPIHGEGAGDEVKCQSPKYIFYSLGNFIFDQEWSRETKEGLTLKITINKNSKCSVPIYGPNDADKSARYNCPDLQGPRAPARLDSIELLPVIIENYSTPRPATTDETKKILEKIGQTENILK